MEKSDQLEGFFSEYGRIRTLTYKDQAYELIKQAILYQKFEMNSIYSQETICQALGISRTPVREALLELQKDGYVRFCRGKGVQIVALDKDTIYDILEMRIYQEMIAAELAAKRATESEILQIRTCLERCHEQLDCKDVVLCYRLDHNFHRAIATAAHSPILYDIISDLLNRYLRFEVLNIYTSYSDATTIWKEHNAIYEAIRQHDSDQARAASQNHLEAAYKRTLGQYWKK